MGDVERDLGGPDVGVAVSSDGRSAALRAEPLAASQAEPAATNAGHPELHYEQVEFWMVWTKGGSNPRFSHQNRAAAEAEAIRLAIKLPRRKFFVVQALTRFWVTPPQADGGEK